MTGPDRAEGAAAPVANGHTWPCSGFYDGNHEPHRKGVWICTCRAEGTAVLSDEERWSESDRRDVAAWLIREADDRVRFFPQRRDGVDALVRHLASLAARAALPGTADTGAREAVERVQALHDKTHWCFNDDEQDNVYETGTEWWPCPTLAALAATPDGHQHAAEES